MRESPQTAFIRLFRTRWLWPRPVPELTPEQEQERRAVQTGLERQVDEMRVRHGLEPLEPRRLARLRRRLRRFFSR